MSLVLDSGLRDAMKALRLTGMLATLDERLAQARDARLGTSRSSNCCWRTNWPDDRAPP